MDTDDVTRGRLLTRREALALLGAAGAAFLAACDDGDDTPAPAATATPTSGAELILVEGTRPPNAPSCVVRPELMEGPFFVDEQLNRSDIRSDPSGAATRDGDPLELTFLVSRVGPNACERLEGAQVDIWQCDARGVYSGVSDGTNDTRGESWLRGYQLTDAQGTAAFTTIYPGWYPGRATHIHFKIRADTPAGPAEFTSQLFFDDDLSDDVHARGAYADRGAAGRPKNADDAIFRQGGDQLLLTLTPTRDGYSAIFTIGLQLDA